jgi:hypothetical protein
MASKIGSVTVDLSLQSAAFIADLQKSGEPSLTTSASTLLVVPEPSSRKRPRFR